jgi:hypothetical protein
VKNIQISYVGHFKELFSTVNMINNEKLNVI